VIDASGRCARQTRGKKIDLYTRGMSAAPSSDHVSQLLQQAIASRALAPGDRVGTEADLARDLNVSRPAVREAVRLLVRANLLRAARGPGGGVFVARSPDRGLAQTVSDAIADMLAMEATSVGELTEVRLLLEVPLAGLAAEHATPAAISCSERPTSASTARSSKPAETASPGHWRRGARRCCSHDCAT
jgi:DNA-binding FadR family transcriptional regulator